MKTSEALVKLKSLATKAGELIYERVKLASQVLTDKTWLDAEFCGDYDKALQTVEADYFPELSKAFGLVRLLTILKEFPEQSTWKQHKYNLIRLWAEYEEKQKEKNPPRQRSERPSYKEENKKLATENQDMKWQQKQFQQTLTSKDTELERLREENDRLKQENAELRGENKTLKAQLAESRKLLQVA